MIELQDWYELVEENLLLNKFEAYDFGVQALMEIENNLKDCRVDCESLAEKLHAIKGMALNFHFLELSDAAFKALAMIKSDQSSEASLSESMEIITTKHLDLKKKFYMA